MRGSVYSIPSFDKLYPFHSADPVPAADLRDPAADAGLRRRHAGDPEGAVTDIEHQPQDGREHAAQGDQAVAVLGGLAMSAVAAEAPAAPQLGVGRT